MAIEFNKPTEYAGTIPAFWRGECKVVPGDFNLTQVFAAKTLIPRGTFVEVNFKEHTVSVCKVAEVVAGGTTTKPRVVKGTLFQKGDNIFKEGESTGVTVSSIDRTNSAYDVITLSAEITGLTAGDKLLEPNAISGENIAEKYSAEFVVSSNKVLEGTEGEVLNVGYDTVVLESHVYPVPDSWKQGRCLKNNPNIIFIEQ